jgi:hypothetical protein
MAQLQPEDEAEYSSPRLVNNPMCYTVSDRTPQYQPFQNSKLMSLVAHQYFLSSNKELEFFIPSRYSMEDTF